jgi:hypothetical protein
MAARAIARAKWPVARHHLGDDPGDDLSEVTTPAERIAMMWPLAVEAWRIAGRSIPTYSRSEISGRLFRPGDPRADEEDDA